LGSRQSFVQSGRPGVSTRQLIHWLIPEGPIVQMYINPQNISYNDKKSVTSQRTKGGFVLQYWGPELTTLNLSGTTGTSGIEGINVLYDVYNNEQVAFDPFALFLAERLNQEQNTLLESSDFNENEFIGSLLGSSESMLPNNSSSPSLASLAFSVEMYWSGAVYRGFFTDFIVKESSESLGLFQYDINFTVTSKRGFRSNFQPWHKSATSGPSDSGPFGPPRSFGPLVGGDQQTPQREPAQVSQQDISDRIASFGLNIF